MFLRLPFLASMLILGPWNKLALTVRWLEPKFKVDFPVDLQPPLHMPIVSGPVKSKKVRRGPSPERVSDQADDVCNVCSEMVRPGDRHGFIFFQMMHGEEKRFMKRLIKNCGQ